MHVVSEPGLTEVMSMRKTERWGVPKRYPMITSKGREIFRLLIKIQLHEKRNEGSPDYQGSFNIAAGHCTEKARSL